MIAPIERAPSIPPKHGAGMDGFGNGETNQTKSRAIPPSYLGKERQGHGWQSTALCRVGVVLG